MEKEENPLPINEKEVMDEVYITYKRNPIALAKYERGFILPKKIF